MKDLEEYKFTKRCRSALPPNLIDKSALLLQKTVINNPAFQNKYSHILHHSSSKQHFKDQLQKKHILDEIKINKLQKKVKRLKINKKIKNFQDLNQRDRLALQLMQIKKSNKYTKMQELQVYSSYQSMEEQLKCENIRLRQMLLKSMKFNEILPNLAQNQGQIFKKVLKDKLVDRLKKQNLNMAGIMKLLQNKIERLQQDFKQVQRNKKNYKSQSQRMSNMNSCLESQILQLRQALQQAKLQQYNKGQTKQLIRIKSLLSQKVKKISQLQNQIQEKTGKINQLFNKIKEMRKHSQIVQMQHQKQKQQHSKQIQALKQQIARNIIARNVQGNSNKNINKLKKRRKVVSTDVDQIGKAYRQYFYFRAISQEQIMSLLKDGKQVLKINQLKSIFSNPPFPSYKLSQIQKLSRYLIEDNKQAFVYFNQNLSRQVNVIISIFKKVLLMHKVLEHQEYQKVASEVRFWMQNYKQKFIQKSKQLQYCSMNNFLEMIEFFNLNFQSSHIHFIQGANIYINSTFQRIDIYKLVQFLSNEPLEIKTQTKLQL